MAGIKSSGYAHMPYVKVVEPWFAVLSAAIGPKRRTLTWQFLEALHSLASKPLVGPPSIAGDLALSPVLSCG